MFENTTTFHGLGVDDLQKAQAFYGETLGLKVRCSTRSTAC